MSSEWSLVPPQAPGLYAMTEPASGANPARSAVVLVSELENGSGLVYGGMRRVEHARPGTIWYAFGESEAPPFGIFTVVVIMENGLLKTVFGNYPATLQIIRNWHPGEIINDWHIKSQHKSCAGYKVILVNQDNIPNRILAYYNEVPILEKDCELIIVDSDEPFAHEVTNNQSFKLFS